MARRGVLTSSTPHLLSDSIQKVVTKREGTAGRRMMVWMFALCTPAQPREGGG